MLKQFKKISLKDLLDPKGNYFWYFLGLFVFIVFYGIGLAISYFTGVDVGQIYRNIGLFEGFISHFIFILPVMGLISILMAKRRFELESAKSELKIKKIIINEDFVMALIDGHENQTTELKSTFNRDLKNNLSKSNISRHSCIKTIAGLQNTTGGYLIIGVEDNKNIIGVENDLDNFSDDKYERCFLDICQTALEPFQAEKVTCNFVTIKNKKVFIVSVKRASSASIPVLVNMPKVKDTHGLYIRRGGATVALSTKETVEFMRQVKIS